MASGGKNKQERERALREQAIELARQGKHARALAAFTTLEELQPQEPDWPRRAADCHRALSNRTGQIEALGRAAEAYASAGALPKAIAMCQMILNLDPAHTRTQARLVELQGKRPARTGLVIERPPAPAPTPAAAPRAVEPPPEPSPPEPKESQRPRPRLDQVLRQRRAALTKGQPRPEEREPAPVAEIARARVVQSAVAGVPPQAASQAPPPVLEQSLPPVSDGEPALNVPESPVTTFLSSIAPMLGFPLAEEIHGPRGSPSGMFRLKLDLPRAESARDDARARAQRALPTTPLFSELGPESLERLIAGAELVEVDQGKLVYRRNDPSDALYVIVSGAVAVLAEGDQRVELYRLDENEFFGEAALISDDPRRNTIEAVETTSLLRIDYGLVEEIIAGEPHALPSVLRFVRDRLLDTLLLTNPLFTVLPNVERRALARRFEFLQLDRGSSVIEQGTPSPGLFVLLCGTVDVARHEAGRTHRLALLDAGGVFGEMSLLDREPAMAEVRCVSPGFALLLPEPEFRAVAAAHPEVEDFLTLLAASRRSQNQALLATVPAEKTASPDGAGS